MYVLYRNIYTPPRPELMLEAQAFYVVFISRTSERTADFIMRAGFFHKRCISTSWCQSTSSLTSVKSIFQCNFARVVCSSSHPRLQGYISKCQSNSEMDSITFVLNMHVFRLRKADSLLTRLPHSCRAISRDRTSRVRESSKPTCLLQKDWLRQ